MDTIPLELSQTSKKKKKKKQPRTYTLIYISNTFITNAWLKLAKKQAKAKQHPEAELRLFENHSLFSSTLSPKNNRKYLKNTKKQVRLFKWGY